MAEDPRISNSEKTLEVHDFIKYEIQGIAADTKLPLNYQIVANEGFLYLHEPKLVKDNENQIKMDPKLTNKTPFFYISDINTENKIDHSTQYMNTKSKSCSTKYSLQQIQSSKCVYKESPFLSAHTKTRGCTTSKTFKSDDKVGHKSNKEKKTTGSQKNNTIKKSDLVSANTSTSAASIGNDDSDREKKLYQLLKKLMNAREKEKQQHEWNCYISELRQKYNTINNETSSYALRDRSNYCSLAFSKQYSSEDCLFTAKSMNLSNERYPANYKNNMHIPIEVHGENFFRNRNNYFCYPTSSQAQIMSMIHAKNRSRKSISKRFLKNKNNSYAEPSPSKGNQTSLGANLYSQFKKQICDNRRSTEFAYSTGGCLRNIDVLSKSALYCGKNNSKDLLLSHNYARKRFRDEPRATIPKVMTNLCKNTQTCDFLRPCVCDEENISSTRKMFGITPECPHVDSKPINEANIKVKENTYKVSNLSQLHDTYLSINNAYRQLVERAENGCQNIDPQQNEHTIKTIEIKIDSLIKSINTLIEENKLNQCTQNKSKRSVAVNYSTTNNTINEEQNFTKSAARPVKSFVDQETLTTNLLYTESNEVIFREEINKSNKAKQDIENIINGYSFKHNTLNIDVPTKERSTEVTESLSKQKIHELFNASSISQDEERLTTAVNTEPLGFLALMQVSTETIKQLLSYVPALTYNPRIAPGYKGTEKFQQNYVCNICGAAFEKSCHLSDHIKIHSIGKARNCCVCRHVLDSENKHVTEFTCQYCGQKFTRAYCCELHQQSCAKHFGQSHEQNPSLMLLR